MATLLNLDPAQVPDDGNGLVYNAASKKWLPGEAVLPENLGIIQAANRGIVADDITDNTAALNTLILNTSIAGGGHIVLPAGVIRLSTALLPQSNVWISGAGQGVTVLMPEQHGFYRNATALNPITNFHLTDLTIDGSNRTGAATWKGYHGQFHLRCSWRNLTIRNTGMTGLGPDMLRDCVISNVTTENTGLENDGTQPSGNGIGIGAGGFPGWESFSIIGCTAVNAKRYGIMIEGGLIRVAARIVGNMARGCGSGGYGLGAGSGAVVTGNTAYGNVGNGFEFSNLTLSSSRMSGECVVSDNVSQNNGGDGITFDATVQRPAAGFAQIVGNVCSGNTGHGIRVAIDLSLVDSAALVTGYKIDGNTCALNGSGGITVATTGSGSFVPTQWTIDNNTTWRNGSVANDWYGIRIATSMSGASIRNNTLSNSLVYPSGISIGYGGAAVTLSHCRIEGNTTGRADIAALAIDAAATIASTCTIQENTPDDGSPLPRTVTANTTLGTADRVLVTNGAATVYVPQAGSVRVGRRFTVKNISATVATLRFVSAGSTIDGATTKALAQWESATIMSDGVSQWLVVD